MDYRVARVLRVVIYLLLGLIVIGLLFVALNGIRNVLRQGNAPKDAPKELKLADYSNNGSKVRYITNGTIQAPVNQQTITITVSQSQSVVEIFRGSSQTPILSQAYANNQASYESFLSALASAGYTKVQESSTTNRLGACPLGNRFSYQVIAANGSLPQDTWNTSCSSKQGTFAGNTSLTRQLFQLQIPNYSTVVNSVNQ
jgi:hypothetical protein